jgi:hypothetical protein
MVASFDSFRHLTVTCIVKTTSQDIRCIIFSTSFLAVNHTVESLFANIVSLCIDS